MQGKPTHREKMTGVFEVYEGKGCHPWRVRWWCGLQNVWRTSEGYPTVRLAKKAALSMKFAALQSPIKVVK